MHKAMYHNNGGILAQCVSCGRLNYVEPHETTSKCLCSKEWTEHQSIPYDCRDYSGFWLIRKPAPNIYKGYEIVTHPITGAIWIKKSEWHVGGAASIDDAKKIIDQLVN